MDLQFDSFFVSVLLVYEKKNMRNDPRIMLQICVIRNHIYNKSSAYNDKKKYHFFLENWRHFPLKYERNYRSSLFF